MPKRILILGITGVDKKQAMSNVAAYLRKSQLVQPDWVEVDFEKDYVIPTTPTGEFHNYLDALADQQYDLWQEAWGRFKQKLDGEFASKDVVLRLHGVVARPAYGARCPVVISAVADDFNPTDIVTLIDDVYAAWHRTEARARGRPSAGRPTLEQLLSARRAERLVGDIIACNVARRPRPRNYVIAVRHPARTLARILFAGGALRPVYLSHPISGPRAREKKRDSSGIEEVNCFLRKASDFEEKNPKLVFFYPLTIDELPLKAVLEEAAEAKTVVLPMARKWNVREFYGDSELLLCDDASIPATIELRRNEVEDAVPILKHDLGTRDYRLVLQSKRVGVCNPCYDGEIARGVRNEIGMAVGRAIPVEIYQDPEHDPEDEARKLWKPSPGSLGDLPQAVYVRFHETPEKMLAALLT